MPRWVTASHLDVRSRVGNKRVGLRLASSTEVVGMPIIGNSGVVGLP